MEANELRIGNLIKYSEDGTIFTVGSIEERGFTVQNDEETTWIEAEEFEPLQLTEEWHIKFGGIKNGFNNFEYVLPRKNNIDLKMVFSGDYIMLRQGEGNRHDDIISIWNKDLVGRDPYVHEFQNLFFALAGEELNVKSDNEDT